jgi:cysteinyl-tRNA synthetase
LFSALKVLKPEALAPEAAAGEQIALHRLLAAFGLTLPAGEAAAAAQDAPAAVRELAERRWQAKQAREWAEADRLRGEVSALGWEIKDGKDGYALSPKAAG